MNILHLPKSNISYIKARPFNYEHTKVDDGTCSRCNQVHLRPGYCQALDPINAEQYPHMHGRTDETFSETDSHAETDNETFSADETDKATAICNGCGEAFQSKRSDARYCSPACRLKSHRASIKETPL